MIAAVKKRRVTARAVARPAKTERNKPRKPRAAQPTATKPNYHDTMGYRIAQAREGVKLSQWALAAALGKSSHGTVSHWESGHAEPRDLDTIRAIAKLTGKTPEFIAFGIERPPGPEALGYGMVSEVVFEDGLKNPRETAKWGVPLGWVSEELRSSHANLLIYKMTVQARPYEYGDRIIVDTSPAACQPSPPGMFLFWDGYGPAVARIAVLPGEGKRPRARTTTGPDGKDVKDVDVDRLKVIGRVRALWRKA